MLRSLHLPLNFCLALSFLIVAAGCNPVRNLNILDTQDEATLGEQFDQEIAQKATLVTDTRITSYVEDLTQRLAKVCKRRDVAYRSRVVESEEINAFAVPGGYVYVNIGLIRAAKNESELAGVIGHEIGHVVGRHGAKQLSKQYGIEILVKMVTGSDPTLTEQIVGTMLNVGATGLLLKYSREDESQADSLGVQNLYDAGLDPNGLANFFETLLTEEGGGRTTKLEQMLSTHPPTGDRIRKARAQIAKLPPRSDLETDSARFRQVQAVLPPPQEDRQTR
ncbi:peptidase M48 [Candidatus Poribacteria bacterium]|nr:peptidase M48 [Candidatus Poribacteria bacterium]